MASTKFLEEDLRTDVDELFTNSNQDNNNTSSAIVVSNGQQFSAISEPNNTLERNEKKSNNDVNINYNTSDSESTVLANFGNSHSYTRIFFFHSKRVEKIK